MDRRNKLSLIKGCYSVHYLSQLLPIKQLSKAAGTIMNNKLPYNSYRKISFSAISYMNLTITITDESETKKMKQKHDN